MRLHIPNTVSLVLSLALGLLSCKKDNAPAISRPLELPAGSEAVITASNQFAFQLFHTVLQQDPAQNNKLVSPLSVYTALSMLYNGAANATRDSIAKTLQLDGISIDDLNALNKALIQQMPGEDSKVAMDISNSMWYNASSPQPLSAFQSTLQNDYNGFIRSLDFSSPSAASTINSWVAQKTNNKIKNVIGNISPADWMYLVNTVYFNGAWMHAFKPDLTHNAVFNSPDGPVNVPFMSGQMRVRFGHDIAFRLVELPYGTGKNYDMYLVAPTDTGQSIEDFAASFNEARLTGVLLGLDSMTIGLELPKWEYGYSIDDLKPHLTQLGMGIAFGNGADLSNMYAVPPGELNVSRVLHKTYIKVSEQGAEAAAVTTIGVSLTSYPAIPIITFDHPFLYILREKQSGAILFIGIVSNPS
ncbi:MAG TPA: serpin family protein [Puia sp.]|nr:serpin family protein [Puia sp.]